MIVKSLLVGLAFSTAGGIVGLFVFALQVQHGWWDGPGGGMIVFPMVLIPAIVCGFYGYARTQRRLPRRKTNLS
jgi:hypothetical protein